MQELELDNQKKLNELAQKKIEIDIELEKNRQKNILELEKIQEQHKKDMENLENESIKNKEQHNKIMNELDNRFNQDMFNENQRHYINELNQQMQYGYNVYQLNHQYNNLIQNQYQ